MNTTSCIIPSVVFVALRRFDYGVTSKVKVLTMCSNDAWGKIGQASDCLLPELDEKGSNTVEFSISGRNDPM